MNAAKKPEMTIESARDRKNRLARERRAAKKTPPAAESHQQVVSRVVLDEGSAPDQSSSIPFVRATLNLPGSAWLSRAEPVGMHINEVEASKAEAASMKGFCECHMLPLGDCPHDEEPANYAPPVKRRSPVAHVPVSDQRVEQLCELFRLLRKAGFVAVQGSTVDKLVAWGLDRPKSYWGVVCYALDDYRAAGRTGRLRLSFGRLNGQMAYIDKTVKELIVEAGLEWEAFPEPNGSQTGDIYVLI